MRRVVLFMALPLAYGVGWLADARLNEDICLEAFVAREGDLIESSTRGFPGSTTCRITRPNGEVIAFDGETTAFWAGFGFMLVVALACVATYAWALRLGVIAVAAIAATALALGV